MRAPFGAVGDRLLQVLRCEHVGGEKSARWSGALLTRTPSLGSGSYQGDLALTRLASHLPAGASELGQVASVLDVDGRRVAVDDDRRPSILSFHAHDLNLKPSWTAYMRWGKGSKQRLRFTNTGDSKLEKAYATHFVWPGKGPFHPPAPEEGRA